MYSEQLMTLFVAHAEERTRSDLSPESSAARQVVSNGYQTNDAGLNGTCPHGLGYIPEDRRTQRLWRDPIVTRANSCGRLIPRRSQVQILPPLTKEPPGHRPGGSLLGVSRNSPYQTSVKQPDQTRNERGSMFSELVAKAGASASPKARSEPIRRGFPMALNRPGVPQPSLSHRLV